MTGWSRLFFSGILSFSLVSSSGAYASDGEDSGGGRRSPSPGSSFVKVPRSPESSSPRVDNVAREEAASEAREEERSPSPPAVVPEDAVLPMRRGAGPAAAPDGLPHVADGDLQARVRRLEEMAGQWQARVRQLEEQVEQGQREREAERRQWQARVRQLEAQVGQGQKEREAERRQLQERVRHLEEQVGQGQREREAERRQLQERVQQLEEQVEQGQREREAERREWQARVRQLEAQLAQSQGQRSEASAEPSESAEQEEIIEVPVGGLANSPADGSTMVWGEDGERDQVVGQQMDEEIENQHPAGPGRLPRWREACQSVRNRAKGALTNEGVATFLALLAAAAVIYFVYTRDRGGAAKKTFDKIGKRKE